MPQHRSARNLEEARSLILKTHGFIPGRRKPNLAKSIEVPADEELALIASRDGLKLLRQVARRVDNELRAKPNQVDALLVVIWLRRIGVAPHHLPVLPSARSLRQVADAGRVQSRAEAVLVSSVLANTELVAELGHWAERLGTALDAWPLRQSARR